MISVWLRVGTGAMANININLWWPVVLYFYLGQIGAPPWGGVGQVPVCVLEYKGYTDRFIYQHALQRLYISNL